MLAPGEPVYDHQSSIANLRGMTEDTNKYEDGECLMMSLQERFDRH